MGIAGHLRISSLQLHVQMQSLNMSDKGRLIGC